MSSIPALNSGILGIQRGVNSAQNQAARIASTDTFSNDNPADLAAPLVQLISDQRQVEASAKVVRTIDQMLGSIIDIKA